MDTIKTIPWKNIYELAQAIYETNLGVERQAMKNIGWCIRINDYVAAKKGSVLYYNIYGGFITRVRKGFSDKARLIFDKPIPLHLFTISERGRKNAA